MCSKSHGLLCVLEVMVYYVYLEVMVYYVYLEVMVYYVY